MSSSTLPKAPIGGFTLIELVMVIVIIGILSAAALPRFSNLTLQAQRSQYKAMAANFKAAVNIAHTAWIAIGAPTTGGGKIILSHWIVAVFR